jgi:hypothetical protein
MTGRQEYDRNMTGRQDDRQDDRQRILDEYMIDNKSKVVFRYYNIEMKANNPKSYLIIFLI